MRIGIYARARTGSVWDKLRSQVAAVRAWATAYDHKVVGSEYRDVCLGADELFREGLSWMLHDALRFNRFDAVVATDMSRISRDPAEIARLRCALEAVGVQLLTINSPDQITEPPRNSA